MSVPVPNLLHAEGTASSRCLVLAMRWGCQSSAEKGAQAAPSAPPLSLTPCSPGCSQGWAGGGPDHKSPHPGPFLGDWAPLGAPSPEE